MKILTRAASNSKTAKGCERFEASILHLAPAMWGDGKHTVCPWAGECAKACLNTTGRGQLRGEITRAKLLAHPIHKARIARTLRFLRDRRGFLQDLNRELINQEKRAAKRSVRSVARLNGTSDIPWESIPFEDATLVDHRPSTLFYDYTKGERRAEQFAAGVLPSNYHLTYSYSERTPEGFAEALLRAGVNVAVVFHWGLPPEWRGWPVIDGTASDWRFEDSPGVVVGLEAKARAKLDRSGFVQEPV